MSTSCNKHYAAASDGDIFGPHLNFSTVITYLQRLGTTSVELLKDKMRPVWQRRVKKVFIFSNCVVGFRTAKYKNGTLIDQFVVRLNSSRIWQEVRNYNINKEKNGNLQVFHRKKKG